MGKALLQMRKMFPNDPVLLKMILHEFKENKIAMAKIDLMMYFIVNIVGFYQNWLTIHVVFQRYFALFQK